MKEIQVTVNGIKRSVPEGIGLSALLGGEHPCGGRGTCGKCKVVARGALSPVSEEERRLLSAEELAKGVRLSCRTQVLGEAEIVTETQAEVRAVTEGNAFLEARDPAFTHFGAAVDIGTTTLAAGLYDRGGSLLAEATALNPQLTCGADVMTRMEAVLGGKGEELRRAVLNAVDGLLSELKQKAKADRIDGLVITGNTAMLCLLTGAPVASMTRAPFKAERLFGETLSAEELGLSEAEGEVYLPPCISAFLGADTTCALLSTALCEGEETRLLADVGTNGELALWHKGRLTVCSTAAGPAFEGAGLKMGMRGETGAVDTVTVKDGRLSAHVIGEGTARGICGSGVVDAVACLLELEILDESGYLEEEEPVCGAVVLTAGDIRQVQLAKSAISAGMTALLHHAGISAEAVERLSLAGGFGRYLDLDNAARIGLIPKALRPVTEAVGNSALSGAAMLLLDRTLREDCRRLAACAAHLELASDPVFTDAYAMGMLFEE